MNTKINIGIVGYGNLGKSVEQAIISNQNINLVAIFSRRLVKSRFNTLVEPYGEFLNYKNKIDIMLLCGGSKCDLEFQTPEILEHFDIINTFDTHAKILTEYEKLDIIAKQTKHRAIICCGWDPGLFSIIRGLFLAFSNNKPYTLWGKGISMGHSDALRRVRHVDDGVQFTIPIKDSISKIKNNTYNGESLHQRLCYVSAKNHYHNEIKKEIKNIPNYFKGQPTKVVFVSAEKVMKLKSNLSHKGYIFNSFKTFFGSNAKMEFSTA